MTKAQFLELCSQRWEDIEHLSKHNNLYNLEKNLDAIWTDLGSKVLESTIGEVPINRWKKKSPN